MYCIDDGQDLNVTGLSTTQHKGRQESGKLARGRPNSSRLLQNSSQGSCRGQSQERWAKRSAILVKSTDIYIPFRRWCRKYRWQPTELSFSLNFCCQNSRGFSISSASLASLVTFQTFVFAFLLARLQHSFYRFRSLH